MSVSLRKELVDLGKLWDIYFQSAFWNWRKLAALYYLAQELQCQTFVAFTSNWKLQMLLFSADDRALPYFGCLYFLYNFNELVMQIDHAYPKPFSSNFSSVFWVANVCSRCRKMMLWSTGKLSTLSMAVWIHSHPLTILTLGSTTHLLKWAVHWGLSLSRSRLTFSL